jgi:hypothetical protein
MWKIWYSQKGQRRKYNTACALCMLDNEGYRHTLRISVLIAFPWQQWLCECASTARLFVHCPSFFHLKVRIRLAYEEGSIFLQ